MSECTVYCKRQTKSKALDTLFLADNMQVFLLLNPTGVCRVAVVKKIR